MSSIFKKNIITLLCIYLTLTPIMSYSQHLLSLSSETNDTIKSKILQNDQQVLIRLPKNYNKNSTSYPVVYYFDAQDETLTNLISVNIDRLMWTKDIPNVIIVGIIQWDRSNLSVEREGNKSKMFLNYVVSELVPYIQKKYNTVDYRVFIGHSLGGQFITYGMTQYPNVFNGVLAISPALFYPKSEKWFENMTLTSVENFRRNNLSKPIHFYYCVGDSGFQDSQFKIGAFNLKTLLNRTEQKHFFWHFDYLTNFTHGNTPTAGIPMGLINIFHDWQFPEMIAANILVYNNGDALKELLHQEEKIKNKYGVKLLIPKQVYWQFGKYCLEKDNYSDAKIIIKKFIERDINDPISYTLMGDLFEKEHNYGRAIEYYEIALTKLQSNEMKERERYQNKINALKHKLN